MEHLNILDPTALQIKTTETSATNFYQVGGDEISWVSVQSKTGTTFNSDPNSHLWTNLGIYSQSDIVKFGLTRAEGGLSDTILSNIYTAYNQTGLLVGSIASTAFRASFKPNLRLTIPITGGTGTLSGLTSLNLYTAFVGQNDSTNPDGSGPCATWLVDCLYNESHPQSTYQAGIGYGYDDVNNPGPNTNGIYRSGIMHLFSEEIYFSGNTGTTWSTAWSGNSRYTFGGSPLAKFDGPQRNESVGFINVDSGIVTLYHPSIVGSFNTSVATGGTITTGLTFNTTDCGMVAKDWDLSTSLEINVTLTPNTFVKSMNPSVLDAKQAGVDCDGQVNITKVCFYDEFKNLVAVGALDTAIVKRPQDYSLLQTTVTLDNGIETSPEEDGRQVFL